jgi:hypothetical protein
MSLHPMNNLQNLFKIGYFTHKINLIFRKALIMFVYKTYSVKPITFIQ